jgi:hypothetical protein
MISQLATGGGNKEMIESRLYRLGRLAVIEPSSYNGTKD